MSTSFEVGCGADEQHFLGTDEVERNGAGSVYGMLSNQLEYIGVYQGLVNGAHRFSGLKIKDRLQYGVSTLRYGFDNHNQDDRITHNDGAKPVVMVGYMPGLLDVSKADFTAGLVPLVADYLRQLRQNPDMPRRINDEDLDAKLGLFERIDQGIKNGSLAVDEDGNCDIFSLFDSQT